MGLPYHTAILGNFADGVSRYRALGRVWEDDNEMPEQQWDVFVSYSRSDHGPVQRIVDALNRAGLRVFLDVSDIHAFESISETILSALLNSRVLLAYYSAEYPTRHACRQELSIAYLAGQHEGAPLRRVLVINPERGVEHIEPGQLRDALLPSPPVSTEDHQSLATAIKSKTTATKKALGAVAGTSVRWDFTEPEYPPGAFIGRWHELWQVHDALHPDTGRANGAPTAPVAVVHGTAGIGKTTLAAEYVRRFGSAFPGGIRWQHHSAENADTIQSDRRGLWVMDNVSGEPDEVRAQLPSAPATPCLLLTRDPRHRSLGTPVELSDLSAADLSIFISAHGSPALARDDTAIQQLRSAVMGGTPVLLTLAKLACVLGTDGALSRLHSLPMNLVRPLERRLRPIFDSLEEGGRDLLRVLTAAAPSPVPLRMFAAIRAALPECPGLADFARIDELVQHLVDQGVIARTDADTCTLPNALALTLRRMDGEPARAEQIRSATLRTLGRHSANHPAALPPSRSAYDEEEERIAFRVQNELINRVATKTLPDDQGSLREALNSLYALFTITRHTCGGIHPAAFRDSTPTRPGLGTLSNRLMNEVLRPFLTYWHTKLGDHEAERPPRTSAVSHERDWAHHDELRQHLREIHTAAVEIATELSMITGNTVGLPR